MANFVLGGMDICPTCGSAETEGESFDTGHNDRVSQEMSCLVCRSDWRNYYVLDGKLVTRTGTIPYDGSNTNRERRHANAEEIVRALASRPPVHLVHATENHLAYKVCTLCSGCWYWANHAALEPGFHNPNCPWRLAKEHIKGGT